MGVQGARPPGKVGKFGARPPKKEKRCVGGEVDIALLADYPQEWYHPCGKRNIHFDLPTILPGPKDELIMGQCFDKECEHAKFSREAYLYFLVVECPPHEPST